MSTAPRRISEKARSDPRLVFTSLYALSERLEKFHLSLAQEKTRCLEFGRFARENARRRRD